MSVTRLLHQAALADVTIYWDDKRRRAVMWSSRKLPPRLVDALEARADEVMALLGRSGFWSCCCPQCRGTVH
ncbi:MAG TPA: hypothetical protein VKG24_31665 [Pseudolabrys sp.]|nr:hypothetical protein [Pseudolabrys sp.]